MSIHFSVVTFTCCHSISVPGEILDNIFDTIATSFQRRVIFSLNKKVWSITILQIIRSKLWKLVIPFISDISKEHFVSTALFACVRLAAQSLFVAPTFVVSFVLKRGISRLPKARLLLMGVYMQTNLILKWHYVGNCSNFSNPSLVRLKSTCSSISVGIKR